MTNVTCLSCGWVHFALPAEAFLDHIHERMHCFRCGGSYMNFRPALEDDCPIGSTIQPILLAEELPVILKD
mgnify:CR=1 FL=1